MIRSRRRLAADPTALDIEDRVDCNTSSTRAAILRLVHPIFNKGPKLHVRSAVSGQSPTVFNTYHTIHSKRLP